MPTSASSLLLGFTDNAILYFRQNNGILTFDPVTGNPIEGQASFLEVKAMIRQRRLFVEQNQRQTGSDSEKISVTGRLIKPAIISLTQLDRKEPIKAVIDGQNCRLLINSTIDSPALVRMGFQRLIGQAFTGQLIYES